MAEDHVALLVSKSGLRSALLGETNKPRLNSHTQKAHATTNDEDLIELRVDAKLRRCGLEMRLVVPPGSRDERPTQLDDSLLKAVARGYVWYEKLVTGKVNSLRAIASELGVHERYVSRILRTAFLAPDIVEAIMEGRQPAQLTIERLRLGAPLAWTEQRKIFGVE